MNELALFAGAGGGILASQIIGANTVCAVERDAYAAGILAQRQNDGLLPAFPIWDDVSTFDGKPWRGIVDLVSGGFPCQDISAAGSGAGIEGSRSGLWKQMLRIVGEIRPGFVFMENSPLIIRRGLAVVISDLAEIGYGMQWLCLSAAECGAHHGRDRFWGLAYPDMQRLGWRQQLQEGGESSGHVANDYSSRQLQPQGRQQDERRRTDNGHLADSECVGFQQVEQSVASRAPGEGAADQAEHASISRGWQGWPAEPNVGRVADGVASRVDKLRCLGNGQVPRVAAAAFEILMGRISCRESEQLWSNE